MQTNYHWGLAPGILCSSPAWKPVHWSLPLSMRIFSDRCSGTRCFCQQRRLCDRAVAARRRLSEWHYPAHARNVRFLRRARHCSASPLSALVPGRIRWRSPYRPGCLCGTVLPDVWDSSPGKHWEVTLPWSAVPLKPWRCVDWWKMRFIIIRPGITKPGGQLEKPARYL